MDLFEQSLRVSKVFTPTAPVDEKALVAGRRHQLKRVIDAVNQKGQHAVIHGERGVGKTSLANVLASFLPATGQRQIITPRVNCDSSDTFASVFEKAFQEISLLRSQIGVGFTGAQRVEPVSGLELLGPSISPDSIRRALTVVSQWFQPVVVL